MRRMGFLSIALAAVMTTWGCGDNARKDNAANAPAPGSAVGTAGSSDVSRGDKDFVHDIAIANMAEIDLANLAKEKASTADVKKFAQMMIDDHTKAGDEFKRVASRYNIEMPAQVDDKHRDTHETLAKKTGFDFDKAYADQMVDGHQDFVDKLESRIDKTKLSDWKARHTDRPAGVKTDAKTEAEAITPEKSDNATTMALNEWAAQTYPVAFAHLEAAKALQKGLKNRTTN